MKFIAYANSLMTIHSKTSIIYIMYIIVIIDSTSDVKSVQIGSMVAVWVFFKLRLKILRSKYITNSSEK